jgi:hypothetical protein
MDLAAALLFARSNIDHADVRLLAAASILVYTHQIGCLLSKHDTHQSNLFRVDKVCSTALNKAHAQLKSASHASSQSIAYPLRDHLRR